jgi:hypothetical protein
MNLDLTDGEAAALLRELDGLIDGDGYFLSPRIKILKAIRAKIRPEPLPPPPKPYAPLRATRPGDAYWLVGQSCQNPLNRALVNSV